MGYPIGLDGPIYLDSSIGLNGHIDLSGSIGFGGPIIALGYIALDSLIGPGDFISLRLVCSKSNTEWDLVWESQVIGQDSSINLGTLSGPKDTQHSGQPVGSKSTA